LKIPRIDISFKPIYKKIAKIALLTIGAVFFTAICSFFIFRNSILEFALKKFQVKLGRDYQTNFAVVNASMTGLTGIKLEGVIICPRNADTLISLDKVECSVRFWPLLKKDIQVDFLNMKGGYFQLSRTDSINNFMRFIKSRKENKEENLRKLNLAESGYRMIEKVLSQVPDDVTIEQISLKVIDREIKTDFTIQSLALTGNEFNGKFQIIGDSLNQHWVASGTAFPDDMNGSISLSSADTQKVILPYLRSKINLTTGFDSLKMILKKVEFNNDQLMVEGIAAVTNFSIQHKRISKNNVSVLKASADFKFTLGEHFISIDSSSVIQLNQLIVHPYLRYENVPEKTYAISLNSEKIKATDFFTSLPQGMFQSIQGLNASGELSYHLTAFLNDKDPWNNQFDSELRKYNFHILNYGEVNLAKLNTPFSYTPYEYGKPMRTFEVGPGNLNFTPLDQISPYLKNAVLCSEDPSFFYHHGFIKDAIRQSIATNYIAKKFKRGASTISMQLVKNIFLTRDKVLSRKFEEVLITWLIENNRITPKERMFEVYLNIIEWGPNVYGIGEAARFYFDKHPSQLTLQESIYLSSIIPRPKTFRSFFGPDGNLRPWLTSTYRFISSRMVMRQWASAEDTIGLVPNVQLKGPAKKFIIITDTIQADTNTILPPPDFFDEQD
jgi:hypothetical protein